MMKSSGGRTKNTTTTRMTTTTTMTTTQRQRWGRSQWRWRWRRNATRPGLADPHILSMTGWLMAGWLAGQSVGRLGRALPTVHVPVPCSCRRVYAPSSLRLCLSCSLYAYSCTSHGGLLLFLSVKSKNLDQRHFFFTGTAGHRRSHRHHCRRHATVSNRLATGYVWTENARRRKKKIKRTSGETTRSGTKIARHAGNRVKGSKRERVREGVKWKERKREKGRIRWGGAFQSRSEAPRVPTTIEKGETCRRGYRRGQWSGWERRRPSH